MANYYCQVAGLPDVAFDGSKAAFTVERFRDELYPALSANDAKCIDLLSLSIDNANILDILKHGEEANIGQVGCYSREELLRFVVDNLRRFKPLVAVGHDLQGEYGHGMHMVYSDLLTKAVEVSADPAVFPDRSGHKQSAKRRKPTGSATKSFLKIPPASATKIATYQKHLSPCTA